MLIDLETASGANEFEGTVCIVGAGIAGLLLARYLGSQGIDTLLLEGGGLDLEARSQEMYTAQMDGRPHAGTTEGRFRLFGGSSTRWGGQLLPYSPDIFRPVAGLPSLGWPIEAADLEPYYADLQRIVQVVDRSTNNELLQRVDPKGCLHSSDIQVRFSKWMPFSKRNLAKTVGKECLHSDRVMVFIHANVVSIERSKTGDHVERLLAKNYLGKPYQFRAKYFIVCSGTIESCRLLLASRTILEAGNGNKADNLGRYFHDHLSVAAAVLDGAARRSFAKWFAPVFDSGILHTPKLEATVPLRRQKKLLAVMAHFSIEEPEGSGIAGVRSFLQCVQQERNLKQLGRAFLTLPQYCGDITRLLWSASVHKRRAVSSLAKVILRVECEQMPQPESRIRLSADRDNLGMPRAIVDWKVSESEHRTVRTFATVVDNFLNQVGVGPLSWQPELWELDDSWLGLTRDAFHPMGGMRMGVNPHTSIVDSNLKVHGVPNLFVASCSVFPSGGSSNPTFTLMALTLRLGEHLTALCSAPWNSRRSSASTKTVLPDSQVAAELSVD